MESQKKNESVHPNPGSKLMDHVREVLCYHHNDLPHRAAQQKRGQAGF